MNCDQYIQRGYSLEQLKCMLKAAEERSSRAQTNEDYVADAYVRQELNAAIAKVGASGS
jgi:hypothetical protein